MPHRIEVAFKPGVFDAAGDCVRKRIREDLGMEADSVKTVEVYTIDADLSSEQLNLLGEELFSDPVIQDFTVDRPVARDFDWLVEVSFKPGVKDNVGDTSKEAAEEILGRKLKGKVYTSKQYLIKGNLEKEQVDRIASELLANDLIQKWKIIDHRTWGKEGIEIGVPKVEIETKPKVEEIDLDRPPDRLIEISKERSLALNLTEMLAIKDYFNQKQTKEERKKEGLPEKPTDVELEALAQTWSEHCKHKIFNAEVEYEENGEKMLIDSLFDTYIKGATREIMQDKDWVESVFWDNAGVMRFNRDWLFSLKCETHNSPSNIEPYGGALTGIVGVYRDPMGTGMGSRIVFGSYGFCTGYPNYNGKLRPKIHPKRLLEGVRKGVEDGGNKSGIPTPYGLVQFDHGYMGKCVIYVAAGGLIPAEVNGQPGWKKEPQPGDLIVMAGGRIGIDGIHGVTAASEKYHEDIPSGHVQIGDPITQKKMMDFIIEARDKGLYTCITDNGGGGLSSSVGETARMSGGFELHLDRAPLKYKGLHPWQILVSESQERMTLAVPRKKWKELSELAEKHGVEVTNLGEYTDSGKYEVFYQGKPVAYLDMNFVHEGLPKMRLNAKWDPPKLEEPPEQEIYNHGSLLKRILSRPNICSKEYIVRQFDHEVQGGSVVKPLVGKRNDVHSDGVVIRPVLDSREGLAIAAGLTPKYSKIDTYHMAACALDEAVRKVIALGGDLDQLALNDNFCWPNPTEDKHKMAQLVRANQALYHYSTAFGTPCISGKDSMFVEGDVKDDQGNEHHITAPPTLQFTAVGKISDVERCVTMDAKRPGDIVYILGETKDELGGSEYYEMLGEIGKNVPKVEVRKSLYLYKDLSRAVKKGLVASIHGCYRGGLGVALAQTAFAGELGMEVELSKIPRSEDLDQDYKLLFSESPGRFIVTVEPRDARAFEMVMKGSPVARVGKVTGKTRLKVKGIGGGTIIDEDVMELKKTWKEPMNR